MRRTLEKGNKWHVFIYLFISGCAGSSRLLGLLSSCGVWASLGGGFSCCGALALGAQASVVVALRL